MHHEVARKIVEYIPKNQLCEVCHKKKASVLCDYTIGEVWNTLSGIPAKTRLTCDKFICRNCATRIAYDTDVCPEHFDILARTIQIELTRRAKDGEGK
jgi:hypothetical protein